MLTSAQEAVGRCRAAASREARAKTQRAPKFATRRDGEIGGDAACLELLAYLDEIVADSCSAEEIHWVIDELTKGFAQ